MKKLKRIVAMTIIILWAILLIATLITAFVDTPEGKTLLRGLLYTDIVLPVVAYAMSLVYKFLRGRGSSDNIGNDNKGQI